jgi:hypothetical protein
MIEVPNRSRFFRLLTDRVVAYRETEKKDDSEPCDIHQREDLFADLAEKIRKLKGMNVPAVVFTVGLRQPPCWLPKEQFYRVTEEIDDPTKQTPEPFAPFR